MISNCVFFQTRPHCVAMELCLDRTRVGLGHDATVSACGWAVALLCPEDTVSLESSPCLVLTAFLPPHLNRSLSRKGEVLITISQFRTE